MDKDTIVKYQGIVTNLLLSTIVYSSVKQFAASQNADKLALTNYISEKLNVELNKKQA